MKMPTLFTLGCVSLALSAGALSAHALAATQGNHDCQVANDRSPYQQYLACPGSRSLAYNALLALWDQGQQARLQKLWQRVAPMAKNFVPLQEFAILLGKQGPYRKAAEITTLRLRNWQKSFQGIPFTRTPPQQPELPSLPELVKDEFETTVQFKQRVKEAQQARQQTVARIERDYRQAVEQFNQAVRDNNEANQAALRQHRLLREQKRKEFLSQALSLVFGRPQLTQASYNADQEIFYARLVSANALFDQPVSFRVPLSKARRFKAKLADHVPAITFDIQQNQLKIVAIEVSFQGRRYPIALTDKSYQFEAATVRLADNSTANFTQLSTMTPQVVDSSKMDREFFNTALSLEQDPQLARLRQQQAELARKQRAARQRQTRDRERKQLQSEIKQQQQALLALGGPEGDPYKGLNMTTHWKFKPTRQKANRLAVIIGNRTYGKGVPLVSYAWNDAKAVRRFVEDAWQVPPENIVYEQDATKGVMEGIFQSTLPARIEKGKTELFVYYSGHGLGADGDAKLLPSDARPDTVNVTGYSRQTLLKQLAALGAKNIVLVLDACYTGIGKNGSPLLAGKPALLKVRDPNLPENTLLITASRSNQIAWMDDKTGHSLLTYYLLKGLQGASDLNRDGRVESTELASYLSTRVNRAALRLHEQSQQPEIRGPQRMLVAY